MQQYSHTGRSKSPQAPEGSRSGASGRTSRPVRRTRPIMPGGLIAELGLQRAAASSRSSFYHSSRFLVNFTL